MTFAITLALLLLPVLAGLAYHQYRLARRYRGAITRRLGRLSATWQPHHHEDHEALMRRKSERLAALTRRHERED